jgi:hypothetical protein
MLQGGRPSVFLEYVFLVSTTAYAMVEVQQNISKPRISHAYLGRSSRRQAA